MEDFKKKLTALRKQAGLSQAEAARQSGTPYRTWQNWENDSSNGRRVPGIAIAWLKLYVGAKNLINKQ